MTDTIRERDNQLYVVNVENDFSEPVRVSLWYPTSLPALEYFYLIDKQVDYDHCGLYLFYSGGHIRYIRLENGGKTVSTYTEQQPIPPPSTRVETRYVRGRWEKLLKSKGWVIA